VFYETLYIRIITIHLLEAFVDSLNLFGLITALILVFITVVFSILIARRRIREQVNKSIQAIYDLGFEGDERPDPTHIHQLAALRPGTRPAAILKKRIGNATMYAYTSIVEGSDSFQMMGYYRTVTIISPNLRLPRFTISPTYRNLDRITTKGMEELDKTDEFRGDVDEVERVRLGIDENYENTHLIQSTQSIELQRFLTSRRIRELKVFPHPYDIRCDGSAFSIDFVPWDNRPENYLKRAVQDAEAIYRIFLA
jgi:hypothetical protein